MEKIAFTIPVNRLEESDSKAVRAALRQSLDIKDVAIDTFLHDAAKHDQYVLNFLVSASQFAKFVILRNDYGGRNWVAELKPRIVADNFGVGNRRVVDFVDIPSGWKFHIRNDGDGDVYAKVAREVYCHEKPASGGIHMHIDAVRPMEVYGCGDDIPLHASRFQYMQRIAELSEETAKQSHKILELKRMLRRAVSVLTHGQRMVAFLRQRVAFYRGRPIQPGGGSDTFLRHSENVIREAKDLTT